MSDLRPYQAQMESSVYKAWETHRSVIAVLATGLGKTFTASRIMDKRRRELGTRPLFIGPRCEIIYDTHDRLRAISGSCCIEMNQHYANLAGSSPIVATIQTLCSRKERFHEIRHLIDPIIFDECHHSVAPSYMEVANYFPNAKILGLTATPNRTDGVGMHNMFEHTAITYDIASAIRDGWLVGFDHKDIEISGVQIDKIRTSASTGDFVQKSLAEAFDEIRDLDQIIEPILQHAMGGQVVVFAASTATGKMIAERLNHRGNVASYIGHETPAMVREQSLADFKKGKFQVLVNYRCFTEGFDHSDVSLVALCQPTKSELILTQMIGRGTRPTVYLPPDSTVEQRKKLIANSSKPICKVISFGCGLNRGELASIYDVLGGKTLSKETRDREINVRELITDMLPSDRLKYSEALGVFEQDMIEMAIEAYKSRTSLSLESAKIYTTVDYRANELVSVHVSSATQDIVERPASPARVKQIYAIRKSLGLKTPPDLYRTYQGYTERQALAEVMKLKGVEKSRSRRASQGDLFSAS